MALTAEGRRVARRVIRYDELGQRLLSVSARAT
jgi:hypothetical protein